MQKLKKEYINLLPREAKRAVPAVGAWQIITVLFVLIWLVFFGLQLRQRSDLQARLESLTAKKQVLDQQVAAVRAELGLTGAPGSNPQNAVLIQSLLKERVLWSEVFKQFSRIVPRGLWFDNLEGSTVGRAEIRIRGGSFNYLTIADFMHAMEQSSYFDKPQLLFAQKSVVQGNEIIGFEIICGVTKPREGR
jgi:Tfp pilus assembly protein PilN